MTGQDICFPSGVGEHTHSVWLSQLARWKVSGRHGRQRLLWMPLRLSHGGERELAVPWHCLLRAVSQVCRLNMTRKIKLGGDESCRRISSTERQNKSFKGSGWDVTLPLCHVLMRRPQRERKKMSEKTDNKMSPKKKIKIQVEECFTEIWTPSISVVS